MRRILIAACCLVLAACNMVVSEKPLFADADRGPSFREGLWVQIEADCALDLKADPKAWPECARPQLLKGGRMVDPGDPSDPAIFLVTGGQPPIMQVEVDMKDKAGKGGAPAGLTKLYAYAGVEVLARDAHGRITEARTWSVQCGPPPPEPRDAKGGAKAYLTRHPMPGLRVDEKGGVCWADAQGPLRRAAAASQAWEKSPNHIRWVRDQD